MKRFLHISFLFLFFIFSLQVNSQTNIEFYDSYDYDLKKQKETPFFSEEYQEYSVPPPFSTKPPLVSPKSPGIPNNPIPGFINPGGFSTQSRSVEQNLILDPYSVDYDTIMKKNKQDELRKKQFRDKMQKYVEEEYVESKSRRYSVIFLLTFPYAAALAYGIAYAGGFQKTPEGSAFIGISAITLSALNASKDRRMVENYRQQKQAVLRDDYYFYVMLPQKKF